VVLAALWQRHKALRWLAGGIMVLALGISLHFLNVERDCFETLNHYMWRLMELVENQPDIADSGGIVLVNAPDYLTPLDEDRVFLRGGEGAVMVDFHTTYAGQIWVNTGIELPEVHAIAYTQILRTGDYSMYPHGPWLGIDEVVKTVRSGQYLYVTQFRGDRFWPVYVGSPNLPGPGTPLVRFGDDEITLTQLDMIYSPARQTVTVRVRWQVATPVFAKPFVHVLCNGALVGQLDADPWGETYPFYDWQPGEIQTEYREIHLSQPFEEDGCHAVLGVYSTGNLLRLTAIDAQTGEALPNDLVAIPLKEISDRVFPYDRSQ
jgi:hypothetical protein